MAMSLAQAPATKVDVSYYKYNGIHVMMKSLFVRCNDLRSPLVRRDSQCRGSTMVYTGEKRQPIEAANARRTGRYAPFFGFRAALEMLRKRTR